MVEGAVTVDCAGGACCVWPVSGGWDAGAGWVAGAEGSGVVLGVVAGLLSEPRPIATAIPTSSTATAVPMISTAGTRYHGMTGSFFSESFAERGRALRSKFSAGRADV